jgi:hypothetical protein
MQVAVLSLLVAALAVMDVFLCAWLWAQITRADAAEAERDRERELNRARTDRMKAELDAVSERHRV